MNTPMSPISPMNTASPHSTQYHSVPSPSESYGSLMTPSTVSSPGQVVPTLTYFGT